MQRKISSSFAIRPLYLPKLDPFLQHVAGLFIAFSGHAINDYTVTWESGSQGQEHSVFFLLQDS